MHGNRNKTKLVQKFSPEDACIAEKWWWLHTVGYAARTSPRSEGKRKCILAHREVVSVIIGRPLTTREEVDHINGDKLDNRRENLRIVTSKQNKENRHNCPYRGTTFCHRDKKWMAQVTNFGKKIHLGRFITRREAADAAAKKRKELGFMDCQIS